MRFPLPVRACLIVVCAVVFPSFASLADTRGDWTAEVFSVEGTGEFRSNGSGGWRALHEKERLFEGDEVRVGDPGRVAIQFRAGYFLRLAGGSFLKISETALSLSEGKLHYFNRTAENSPDISTPLVTAAIRGTELVAEASKRKGTISVLEGSAVARNKFGEVTLAENESASAAPGAAPVKSLIVSSKDMVQWTISFPALADEGTVGRLRASKHPGDAKLAKIIDDISRGDIDEADSVLRSAGAASEPGLLSGEKLLFALGSGDAARAEALFAELGGDSSSAAALARSYYLQSRGDLESSLKEAERARALNPASALASARLAELYLYFGKVDDASALIEGACGNVCTDPRLRMLQGYLSLVTQDAGRALSAFDEALAAAPSLSQAYMGRGLALVRENDIAGAREAFQRAIALDPSISVYRSYLGKLNFETDDNARAYREYAEAMRLDSNDPTPYLYRAYAKMSDNDPIGAIGDIETSISKNENRAVYRSRLLLDQDSASRSAALSRAFRETGFIDAARVEAIKSLSGDPANYSAYRLLGESYDAIFFADTAFSELRKARLLAPLSVNLQETSGSVASLNSYDTLFEGNVARTGIAYLFDGRDDIHIPSLATVGKNGSTTWGFSTASAVGDGTKHGSFLRDTLVDAAIEEQLDWDKKLLFQGTGRFVSTRDLNSEAQDIDSTDGIVSVSYVQRFDNDRIFILDTGFERVLDRVGSPLTGRSIDFSITAEGQESEDIDDLLLDQILHEKTNLARTGVQFISSGDPISFIAGSQFIYQRPDRREESLIEEDSLGFLTGLDAQIETASRSDLTGHDTYFYGTVPFGKGLNLTLGVTRTDIEVDHSEIAPFLEETASDGRFNPKAGLTWEPVANMLIRTSYTESLRKSSLEDQLSLEPSIVSGIPQRFNDLTGSTARDAGVGVDWKIPGSTYAGAEYIYRRVTEPFWAANEGIFANIDTGDSGYTLDSEDEALGHRGQHLARGYFNQVLASDFALNLLCRHAEDGSRDDGFHDSVSDDSIGAAIRWFHHSGVFAFFGPTWLRQDRSDRVGFDDGIETAWIWNGGAGWRLPNRRGRFIFEARNIFGESFVLDQISGFGEFLKPETSFIGGFEYNF